MLDSRNNQKTSCLKILSQKLHLEPPTELGEEITKI